MLFSRQDDELKSTPVFLTRRMTLILLTNLENVLEIQAVKTMNLPFEARRDFLEMERAGALEGTRDKWDQFDLQSKLDSRLDKEKEEGQDLPPAYETFGYLVTNIDIRHNEEAIGLVFKSEKRPVMEIVLSREDTYRMYDGMVRMCMIADWGIVPAQSDANETYETGLIPFN